MQMMTTGGAAEQPNAGLGNAAASALALIAAVADPATMAARVQDLEARKTEIEKAFLALEAEREAHRQAVDAQAKALDARKAQLDEQQALIDARDATLDAREAKIDKAEDRIAKQREDAKVDIAEAKSTLKELASRIAAVTEAETILNHVRADAEAAIAADRAALASELTDAQRTIGHARWAREALESVVARIDADQDAGGDDNVPV
jgi:chromosome segregation ATPase